MLSLVLLLIRRLPQPVRLMPLPARAVKSGGVPLPADGTRDAAPPSETPGHTFQTWGFF